MELQEDLYCRTPSGGRHREPARVVPGATGCSRSWQAVGFARGSGPTRAGGAAPQDNQDPEVCSSARLAVQREER